MTQQLTKAQAIMVADGLPVALLIDPEARRQAWKGWTFTKPRAEMLAPVIIEDSATRQLRKELEAAAAKKKEKSLQRLHDYKAFQNRSAPKPELKPRAIEPTIRAIAPTQQELDDMATTARKKISTKTAGRKATKTERRGASARKAEKAKKRAPKAAADPNAAKVVRPGSKLEIVVGLLRRAEGCTAADVLKATGWPAVSMPQQARAAGLTMTQEKDGKVTRYRAA